MTAYAQPGIYAKPSTPFQATLDGAPAGITGTLGVRVERPDGTNAVARRTTGIVEVETGSGVYVATITAPATEGDYLVLWDDGAAPPNAWAQEPLTVTSAPPIPAIELRPDLTDVGALLRARTRSDATGGETGTFDTHTRPTATEVNDYLDQAVIEVQLRLPADIPDNFVGFARRLAALRAAMMVELSYDPDRTGDGSAYDRLREQYDSGLTALQDALQDTGHGTTPRIASQDLVSPTLAPYPDDVRALIAPPWPVP